VKAPIVFETNPDKYQYEGATKLVNAYAEKGGEGSKGPLTALPCEGLIEFTDTESGPCRGMIFLEDLGKFYSIHSSGAYSIDSAGVATRIGTVPGIDQVQLSRNQKADPQVIVQSATGVQFIESDTLSYSADGGFPADVISADVISNYAVYGQEDGTFTLSGINDAKSVDALDFDNFDFKAGKLIRVHADSGDLIGFCSSWTEFFRDSGQADFPFTSIGTPISRGLLAKNSVTSCDNTLFFIGDDNNAYRLDNYRAAILPDHELSRLIEEDAAAEDIIGFSMDRGGHKFACFSGTGWSRCYDAATQVWHSRESYHQTTWRARHSTRAFGYTIVGDALSGKLFRVAEDTFTEDGGTFVWSVVSPPLHVFPNGAILDAVHFDLATGYGTLTGQGSDPKVMLRTSTDGGHQFGNYRELSLGTTGNNSVRVTARRLGKFGPKGIVFELSISDPVVRALVGCDVELRPLKR
jgi:hypothetical protein